MASSGLFGPYSLTKQGVDGLSGNGPGAYALGHTDASGVFKVQYVGRSDDDLVGRLRKHIPEPYQQFKHAFYQTAKAAFDKECSLYHDFTPPDNKVHPAKSPGTNWACPVCGQ